MDKAKISRYRALLSFKLGRGVINDLPVKINSLKHNRKKSIVIVSNTSLRVAHQSDEFVEQQHSI